MRLGGQFSMKSDPEQWVRLHKEAGYSAAFAYGMEESGGEVEDYLREAQRNNLLIAEVGAWSNPIDIDEKKRREAIAHCQERLAFAERIGARCCVNIAGSRSETWDGPHPDNLSEDTFALIVETVRTIIDAVQPTRTFYTLETMPWIFPDSPDHYLKLIHAIDRKGFAVHLDPVNMINSPSRYFQNAAFLKECFDKIGPYIKSCHAKDITLDSRLTVHLDEARPGLGALDYKVFLQQMNRLDPDTPLMLEHLSSDEEYGLAAQYIRQTASEIGISIQ